MFHQPEWTDMSVFERGFLAVSVRSSLNRARQLYRIENPHPP